MTFWAEVFLGIIALATLTMASIQVGLIVYGWTVAKRVNRLLAQVERDMKPVTDSLMSVARDAARISALAAGQVERVDRLVTDLSSRIEQTATTVQDTILRPLREGAALVAGIKAAIDLVKDIISRPAAKRARTDEEDALFIG